MTSLNVERSAVGAPLMLTELERAIMRNQEKDGVTYHSPRACRVPDDEIERRAGKFADEMGIVPGQPLEEIAAKLGGRVNFHGFKGASEDLEWILVHPGGAFDINLPEDTSALRDRYTVAHELGHLYLHFPLVESDGPKSGLVAARKLIIHDRGTMASRQPNQEQIENWERAEEEADRFARALLMRSDDFSDVWNSTNRDQRSKVLACAYFFEVSQNLARWRAKEMGLV